MGGFKVGGDSGSWPWPHRSLSEQLNCSLKPENMKSFFKYLLATVIGMLIVSLIMFFVTIGTIGAMFASSGSSTTKPVKDNSILRIDLDKTIADKTQESNFDNFEPPRTTTGLRVFICITMVPASALPPRRNCARPWPISRSRASSSMPLPTATPRALIIWHRRPIPCSCSRRARLLSRVCPPRLCSTPSSSRKWASRCK